MEVIGKVGACVCIGGVFLPERPGIFYFVCGGKDCVVV